MEQGAKILGTNHTANSVAQPSSTIPNSLNSGQHVPPQALEQDRSAVVMQQNPQAQAPATNIAQNRGDPVANAEQSQAPDLAAQVKATSTGSAAQASAPVASASSSAQALSYEELKEQFKEAIRSESFGDKFCNLIKNVSCEHMERLGRELWGEIKDKDESAFMRQLDVCVYGWYRARYGLFPYGGTEWVDSKLSEKEMMEGVKSLLYFAKGCASSTKIGEEELEMYEMLSRHADHICSRKYPRNEELKGLAGDIDKLLGEIFCNLIKNVSCEYMEWIGRELWREKTRGEKKGKDEIAFIRQLEICVCGWHCGEYISFPCGREECLDLKLSEKEMMEGVTRLLYFAKGYLSSTGIGEEEREMYENLRGKVNDIREKFSKNEEFKGLLSDMDKLLVEIKSAMDAAQTQANSAASATQDLDDASYQKLESDFETMVKKINGDKWHNPFEAIAAFFKALFALFSEGHGYGDELRKRDLAKAGILKGEDLSALAKIGAAHFSEIKDREQFIGAAFAYAQEVLEERPKDKHYAGLTRAADVVIALLSLLKGYFDTGKDTKEKEELVAAIKTEMNKLNDKSDKIHRNEDGGIYVSEEDPVKKVLEKMGIEMEDEG